VSIVDALIACFDHYVETMPIASVDALKGLLSLLKSGDADKFLDTMKGDREYNRELLEGFKTRYAEDPLRFEEETYDSCARLRRDYLQAARTKLNTVTGYALVDSVTFSQTERFYLGAGSQNQLLQVSVADDFVSRLPGGVDRAERLLEWSVNESVSEQADMYMAEVCNCFLYGLDASCVVMCRTLLEEVLRRKIPQDVLTANGISQDKDRTLGRMVDIVKKNRKRLGIHRDVPDLLDAVTRAGYGALDQEPVTGSVALECLQQTRKAIVQLL
jgi:hypothetical protein